MPNILTITLNPALDISTFATDITPGPKLRCEKPTVDAGGGGLNVSRAIALLGGQSRALAAIGGSVGLRLASILKKADIDLIPFQIDSETRQSLAVTDRVDAKQFRFVLPGPIWNSAQVSDVIGATKQAITDPTILVVSGSNPPGVPPGFIGELNREMADSDVDLVADVSGEQLQWLVDNPSGLFLLRMDAAEAQELSGRSLKSRKETAGFARTLVANGVADTVVIARGADGSVMVDRDAQHHCRCEVSTIRSKVGAGDSFVAGMVLALAKGAKKVDALRHGVAAASAAVITEATELCKPEDALRLLDRCELSQI